MTMHRMNRIAAAAALVLGTACLHPAMAAPVRNVVLVHGFFADGSGWQGVAKILVRDGYKVAVVQQPETSLEDDVKATTRALDAMEGKSILVGHSYGGVVITEAGNSDKVAGLVYVSAFVPDAGESVLDLSKKTPAAGNGITPTADGILFYDHAKFRADFAADLPAAEAAFMSVSQVMPNGKAAGTPVKTPAWKTKPSWMLVTKEDRMINPELQRFMAKRANATAVEIHGSHVGYISHPADVARLIEQAAAAADKN
jgi:pimeloyl-ACP methyl ester carboxylesterase